MALGVLEYFLYSVYKIILKKDVFKTLKIKLKSSFQNLLFKEEKIIIQLIKIS